VGAIAKFIMKAPGIDQAFGKKFSRTLRDPGGFLRRPVTTRPVETSDPGDAEYLARGRSQRSSYGSLAKGR